MELFTAFSGKNFEPLIYKVKANGEADRKIIFSLPVPDMHVS